MPAFPEVRFSEIIRVDDGPEWCCYVRLELECFPQFLYSRVASQNEDEMPVLMACARRQMLAKAREIKAELNQTDLGIEVML